MADKKFNCPDCKLRARYIRKPKSLLGRFWRFHTHFCPGWKAYMASLNEEERHQLNNQLG
jgi:hypothetical protein